MCVYAVCVCVYVHMCNVCYVCIHKVYVNMMDMYYVMYACDAYICIYVYACVIHSSECSSACFHTFLTGQSRMLNTFLYHFALFS